MAATAVRVRATSAGLLAATHPGPALAVTALAALLAISAGLTPARGSLVVAAVLTGQLSIGWSNDLIDAARDREAGRADKPLATGTVPTAAARVACALAVVATIGLSLACGLVVGLVHLVVVAAGWAYNLGLKSTVFSWLPYAVAFAALPAFVSLAAGDSEPGWVPVVGAMLGVGAHLLNVLPDLAADAATGVRGLPHRLGARVTRVAAVLVLGAGTAVLALLADLPAEVLLPGVSAVAVLSVLALTGRGAAPFRAAVGIALVDVTMLVLAR